MRVRQVVWTTVLLGVASGVGYAVAPSSEATAGPSGNAAAPVRTGAAAALPPSSPGVTETSYVPVPACRVVNTAKQGGRIHPGNTRSFFVAGSTGFVAQGGNPAGCGIPSTASAVSAHVAAIGATKAGNFSVFPAGSPSALATLYYTKNAKGTTGSTVQLASGAVKSLSVKQNNGNAQLLIDVTGYYVPPMNAFVETNGTLTETSGRATTSTHPSTGNYVVTFDRDVSTCAYTVTPYQFNWVVATGPQAGDPASVHIFIHDQGASTTPHDTSFYIQVTC